MRNEQRGNSGRGIPNERISKNFKNILLVGMGKGDATKLVKVSEVLETKKKKNATLDDRIG